MTFSTKTLAVLLALILSACSSTSNLTHESFSLEKKPLTTDHQLLLSLLNRPLPEDQLMMMQFAKNNALANNYSDENFSVNYVNIRGDRTEDMTAISIPLAYSQLVYQDQNSIAIGAPR